MRRNLAPPLLLLLALGVCIASPASAQATVSYPFAPIDTYGFDSINRGNLNVHFSIPVFAKPGRGGSNFSYALNYDGLI